MALIALAADKGSPGVTTAAVALSAVWPRRALLAEVDMAGGDLVYRCSGINGGPLDPNTGMLSLAAMSRRGLAAEQLWDHSQRISGGMDVIVGLGAAEQSAGLAGQWGTLGRAFAALADSPHAGSATDVLADCGRIGPDSANIDLLQHADLVLLLSRGEPEQISRVRDRAAALSARLHGGQHGVTELAQPAIGVLLVADPQGGSKVAGQVNDMLVASRTGARVMGVIAHDAVGAEQLAGRRRGRVEKSLLVRSVRRVVSDLHAQYGTGWTAGGASAPVAPQRQAAPPQQPAPQQQAAPQQPGPQQPGPHPQAPAPANHPGQHPNQGHAPAAPTGPPPETPHGQGGFGPAAQPAAHPQQGGAPYPQQGGTPYPQQPGQQGQHPQPQPQPQPQPHPRQPGSERGGS
ncbi:hypothetical protein [Streptomyces sp. ODS28]|uniref:hypothetical protein n=1 Tax=Streptomyces sp. ODS28 TaxID=3136688 RepID=UPI0031EA9453